MGLPACVRRTNTSSPRQEKLFIWPPFFQYNKRLLCQKMGGACLYMPQDSHLLASFEVIPPKKVSFPAAKKRKFPTENCFPDPNFFLKNLSFYCLCGEILSRRSRLSRWSRAPFRRIRPRPIVCDGGHDRQTMISRFFEEDKHKKKVFFSRPASSGDLHPKRSP